jgi:hypothetical protein
MNIEPATYQPRANHRPALSCQFFSGFLLSEKLLAGIRVPVQVQLAIQ